MKFTKNKTEYEPLDSEKSEAECKTPGQAPYVGVSFISKVSVSWLSPWVWKIFRNKFDFSVISDGSDVERCAANVKKFDELWKAELAKNGREKASFGWVIMKFDKAAMFTMISGMFLVAIFAFLIPSICVKMILDYLAEDNKDVIHGLLLVLLLVVVSAARSFFRLLVLITGAFLGPRIRNYTMALIYQKILRIRNLGDSSVGMLVNVAATDGHRIQQGILLSVFVIMAPPLIISGLIFAVVEAGPWALLGFAVFFIQVLLVVFLSTLVSKERYKAAAIGDKRMKLISEMLSCIKIVKIYAWEKAFFDAITALRSKECISLFKTRLYITISIFSSSYALAIAQVVTILALVVSGQTLFAAKAFTLISVLTSMKIAVDSLPNSASNVANIVAALTRIKSVLLMEEFDPPPMIKGEEEEMTAIKFENATFGYYFEKMWRPETKQKTKKASKKEAKSLKSDAKAVAYGAIDLLDSKDDDAFNMNLLILPAVRDLNFTIQKGELVGICGAVGTGKTTLLQAILGRLKLSSGNYGIGGHLAYVAQEAWILNATLQENIVFDNPFDESRYIHVLKVCCLEDDIKLLPAGDLTEIGERGINLSGGQKQRISLARAVYSNRDIYLLDDPLSAVDSHVGAHIFNQCIKEALHGKTILFVTHQVKYLCGCDSVIFLKDSGMMPKQTHEDLMQTDHEYSSMIQSVQSAEEEESNVPKEKVSHGDEMKTNIAELDKTTSGVNDGKLIKAEAVAEGGVSSSTYMTYIHAMGGWLFFLAVFITAVIGVLSQAVPILWLTVWLENGIEVTRFNRTMIIPALNPQLDPNWSTFLSVFSTSPILVVVTGTISTFMLAYVTVYRVSKRIHLQLLKRIIRATMTFFDTTPIGQIQNRFSTDMDQIDTYLPQYFQTSLINIIGALVYLATIAYSAPWILIGYIPLLAAFIALWIVSKNAVRDLKRIENIARSPQYSMISSTAYGLSTITAYGKSNQFYQKFCSLLDGHCVRLILNICGIRWIGFRMEIISLIIVLMAGLFAIFTTSSTAQAGLGLTYAIQLSGIFFMIVNSCNEGLGVLTCVERIDDYIQNVEQEYPAIMPANRPEQTWPDRGEILFYDYSLQYQKHMPTILDHVTLRIEAQEKIGIVGRTGAGKSSLMVALFRLIEPSSGTIFIDGVDITKIGLEDLRSNLSLIPQDPVLFNATIRYNVDPFNLRTDVEIWDAFEKTHLKNKIMKLDAQLEFKVAENGSNFSVGERQLICMARALLHGNKILLLDEATASVDPQTDALIQETIRTAFTESTMLIIAHRLNTVLDCDKILVMDKGKIAEFDRPAVLLDRPDSLFKSLLQASAAR